LVLQSTLTDIVEEALFMENGKIKRLTDRGFGFILAADGKEVFFHRSECQSIAFESLTEGQEVSFDRESDVKGPRARNVQAT
jgi:CspA family cold shock protein